MTESTFKGCLLAVDCNLTVHIQSLTFLLLYRRSLYSQVFDMKKPMIKTFEGVYIEQEPEDDSCWKKCLSSLYHAHHVHPAIAKQNKLNPGHCTINVSWDQILFLFKANDYNFSQFHLSIVGQQLGQVYTSHITTYRVLLHGIGDIWQSHANAKNTLRCCSPVNNMT